MKIFPIPPDYAAAAVALERAREEWGSRDAVAKLLGLLIGGKLRTWKLPRRGPLEEIAPEAYRDEEIQWVLTFVDSNRIQDEPDFRIVFQEAELDRVLPSLQQKADRDKQLSLADSPLLKALTEDRGKGPPKGQAEPKGILLHRRPRGVTPSQSPRIEAEMRKLDRRELEGMKGKQMADKFGAAISTCMACRDRVLSGNVEK